MIRYGEVSSIFPEKGTVKVVFKDLTDIPSAELPVFQARTHKTKHYSMPKLGEVGLCLFPENSFNGFYLGSGYDEAINIPNGANENIEISVFADGTTISYDENNSKLYINCKNEIEIISANKIKINCPLIKIEATTTQITSPTLNIIGNINHNGNFNTSGTIVAQGEVTGNGVNLSTHVHRDVKAGLDKTGGPE